MSGSASVSTFLQRRDIVSIEPFYGNKTGIGVSLVLPPGYKTNHNDTLMCSKCFAKQNVNEAVEKLQSAGI